MSFVTQSIPKQFLKSSRETELYCEEHSGEMVHTFLGALEEAVEQTRMLQKNRGKGKIQSVLFSHLYSSMFLRQYKIRIDMMDSQFYNDSVSSVSYWDACGIYRLFEEDIGAIREQLCQCVPRIREYEVDYIRYAYMPYYHSMAKAFVQAMVEEVFAEGFYVGGGMECEKEVRFLFGEYMGQAEIFYSLKE